MGWDSQLRKYLAEKSLKNPNPAHDIPSSVLVLIGTNGQNAEFILTKRTHSVMTHKGQVSFPGGYKEPEDQNLLETALRESHEEIGLNPQEVEVLGMLEPVDARGIFVAPWVGVMKLPYPFTLNPNEVERLLHLPVDRLISEGLSSVDVEEPGFKVQSVGIRIGEDLVWGATARMLEQVRKHLLPSA